MRRTADMDLRSTSPQWLKSGSGRLGTWWLWSKTGWVSNPLAYAFTSSSLILPRGPLPVTRLMSIPNSRANRRMDGVAGAGSPDGAAALVEGRGGTATGNG